MSIEEIKKEIISDAERRRKEITEKAEREAERIIEEARKKAEEIFKSHENKASEEAEKIINQKTANAKIKARSIILKEKRKFLEKIIQESIEELKKSENYKNNLEKRIKELEKTADMILVSRDDFEFIKARINSNKIKNSNIKAGFIAKLGSIEIESTSEAILKIKEEKIMRELNKVLFQNHDKHRD